MKQMAIIFLALLSMPINAMEKHRSKKYKSIYIQTHHKSTGTGRQDFLYIDAKKKDDSEVTLVYRYDDVINLLEEKDQKIVNHAQEYIKGKKNCAAQSQLDHKISRFILLSKSNDLREFFLPNLKKIDKNYEIIKQNLNHHCRKLKEVFIEESNRYLFELLGKNPDGILVDNKRKQTSTNDPRPTKKHKSDQTKTNLLDMIEIFDGYQQQHALAMKSHSTVCKQIKQEETENLNNIDIDELSYLKTQLVVLVDIAASGMSKIKNKLLNMNAEDLEELFNINADHEKLLSELKNSYETAFDAAKLNYDRAIKLSKTKASNYDDKHGDYHEDQATQNMLLKLRRDYKNLCEQAQIRYEITSYLHKAVLKHI